MSFAEQLPPDPQLSIGELTAETKQRAEALWRHQRLESRLFASIMQVDKSNYASVAQAQSDCNRLQDSLQQNDKLLASGGVGINACRTTAWANWLVARHLLSNPPFSPFEIQEAERILRPGEDVELPISLGQAYCLEANAVELDKKGCLKKRSVLIVQKSILVTQGDRLAPYYLNPGANALNPTDDAMVVEGQIAKGELYTNFAVISPPERGGKLCYVKVPDIITNTMGAESVKLVTWTVGPSQTAHH